MQLTEILSILPFYNTIKSIENIAIKQIQKDNRLIKRDDIFICINGFTVDGHDYAQEAITNGATVVIAERPLDITGAILIVVPDTNRALALLAAKLYDFPTRKLPLIGITGTNGKTTTSYILEAICQEAKKKTGLIGTIQAKIGEKVIPIQNTTPDALELQRLFNDMVDQEVAVAMMEVSSHALDLGRAYGCDFDIAVFTNLTQDHLDYHEDMADYLRAKTLLFTALGNDYGDKKKFAVLNADDEHSEVIAKSTAQHIITYGTKNAADVRATEINITATGTKFKMITTEGTVEIASPLIGNFNVYNMLTAATVALLLEIPLEIIKHTLDNFTGVSGRFEQVRAGQDFTVIVDYAHTPDSLKNVLETVKDFSKGKIYVVVGTGGDRDKTKRPIMADVSTKYADLAIFTTDNPRTEAPKTILEDMIKGIKHTNFQVIEDRKTAINKAIKLAEKNDIILIAGKGHETYQEVNRIRYDFDDRLVAKEAIEQKE